MKKKRRIFLILSLLSLIMFAFTTTAYARDIGSWTKNLYADQRWNGTVTRTKYHSTERAVFNVTHPNAYIRVHGTNNGADVYIDGVSASNEIYNTCYNGTQENRISDDSRIYKHWNTYLTGETYLTIWNHHDFMVDTKGTWSPDET